MHHIQRGFLHCATACETAFEDHCCGRRPKTKLGSKEEPSSCNCISRSLDLQFLFVAINFLLERVTCNARQPRTCFGELLVLNWSSAASWTHNLELSCVTHCSIEFVSLMVSKNVRIDRTRCVPIAALDRVSRSCVLLLDNCLFAFLNTLFAYRCPIRAICLPVFEV